MVLDVESGEFLPSLFLADQQRAQAEQDAKFRAGMMLKIRRSKAQKNIIDFKNLKEGFKCDARDRCVRFNEPAAQTETVFVLRIAYQKSCSS